MYRLATLLLSLWALEAHAQPSPETDIRSAFARWTENFNTGQKDEVCDLFAKDLQSEYRGVPSRGYERQCQILQESLSDPTRRYSYTLNIREVLVFGDIAIARVIWTLTIRKIDGQEAKVTEPSLDVLRREIDGKWRVIRYLAYDEP